MKKILWAMLACLVFYGGGVLTGAAIKEKEIAQLKSTHIMKKAEYIQDYSAMVESYSNARSTFCSKAGKNINTINPWYRPDGRPVKILQVLVNFCGERLENNNLYWLVDAMRETDLVIQEVPRP